MRTPIAIIKQLILYRRLLKAGDDSAYQASLVSDMTYLAAAKQLHANIYLGRNFIAPTQLNEHGHLSVEHDPYQEHADYFVVTRTNGGSSEVIVTARQIKAQNPHGHISFPTVSKLELYPESRASIEVLDPVNCIEISALAKRRGESSFAVLMLYRYMWHYSLRNGHQLWLMACDEAVYAQLQFLFGAALVEIGPKTYYMGSWVVPAMLNVDRSVETLTRNTRTMNPFKYRLKRDLAAYLMRGMPTPASSPKTAAARELVGALHDND